MAAIESEGVVAGNSSLFFCRGPQVVEKQILDVAVQREWSCAATTPQRDFVEARGTPVGAHGHSCRALCEA